jgi:hypothetical protein
MEGCIFSSHSFEGHSSGPQNSHPALVLSSLDTIVWVTSLPVCFCFTREDGKAVGLYLMQRALYFLVGCSFYSFRLFPLFIFLSSLL